MYAMAVTVKKMTLFSFFDVLAFLNGLNMKCVELYEQFPWID